MGSPGEEFFQAVVANDDTTRFRCFSSPWVYARMLDKARAQDLSVPWNPAVDFTLPETDVNFLLRLFPTDDTTCFMKYGPGNRNILITSDRPPPVLPTLYPGFYWLGKHLILVKKGEKVVAPDESYWEAVRLRKEEFFEFLTTWLAKHITNKISERFEEEDMALEARALQFSTFRGDVFTRLQELSPNQLVETYPAGIKAFEAWLAGQELPAKIIWKRLDQDKVKK
jgi:hypothetical protein